MHTHVPTRRPRVGSRPRRLARRGWRAGGPGERGFTLVEVLIAAVILVTGVLSLFALLEASLHASASTRERETATNLARAILEDAHTIPYAQLSPTAIEGQLQAMAGLADASPAPGWQIIANGVTYTVTAQECSIDDPKDGYGVHDSTFCPESSTTGTEDMHPANLKRITVKVAWSGRGRSHEVQAVATISSAGEAIGLSASALQLSAPVVPKKTEPFITTEPGTLTFTVSAPAEASSVLWSLDGARQTPAATHEAGTTWTFTWSIAGLSDGVYKVAAQAVTSTGVVGPPASISVTLIRNVPGAPKAVVGGFNTVTTEKASRRVVELRWQPNPERNVIGYRVYRPGPKAGERQLACPASLTTLSTSVTCTDFSPPSPLASNLTYQLVALYRKAEGEALSAEVSEGAVSSFTVTGGEPLPSAPSTPPTLKAEKNADGSVTLTWTAPSTGPSVSFYRVYRGTSEYAGRYDFTGSGSTVTYTDTDALNTHGYWVTAVGTNLAESAPVGPVTG